MTPREIGEAAVGLQEALAGYQPGDRIAVLASALCSCLDALSTTEEQLNGVLLVLAAFSEIGVDIDYDGHPVIRGNTRQTASVS